MTVRSGELTDLIVFEKKVRTYDGEIEYTTWVRDFQEWADAQRLAEQITTYRIHYRKGITPDTHRILAFDSIWTITNVLPDARYAELKIECDWSAQIEVTHMKSPTREWITGLPAVAIPISTEEDDEFMNPVIVDLTDLVTFPQAGAGIGGNGQGPILAIMTGKLVTLVLDIVLHLPPGLGNPADLENVSGFQIQLPPQFAGKESGDPGGDYSASFYFDNLTTQTPPIPSTVGGMYIQKRIGLDKLGLYFWNAQLATVGGDVYVAGQITYVIN